MNFDLSLFSMICWWRMTRTVRWKPIPWILFTISIMMKSFSFFKWCRVTSATIHHDFSVWSNFSRNKSNYDKGWKFLLCFFHKYLDLYMCYICICIFVYLYMCNKPLHNMFLKNIVLCIISNHIQVLALVGNPTKIFYYVQWTESAIERCYVFSKRGHALLLMWKF